MSNAATIPFRKMNGLGNEFVVVDCAAASRCAIARRGRPRHRRPRPGSRFDQMMVLRRRRRTGTDAFMRIHNRDGSEVEACGNATRCVGWLVAEESGPQRR